MNAINTLVFLMMIAVLLVAVAQKLKISYPIALVLGGSVLGFIPGLTPIDFDPMTLLFIVLPPILFYASYSLSFKEFIRYFREIFSLAIGLVIATTIIVGLIFKWLFPEYSWPLAFAFGALIAPPDAVAATTILKRFAISSRLRSILEGESLINDATGLVIYRFAVIAILTGSFSFKEASLRALDVAIGGIFVGLVLGYILNKISALLNPVLSVVYSFIIPYLTFSVADYLGFSGVLAVVVCGLLGARMLITQFNPLTRVLGWASWDVFIILLNCFIFTLIGLEFGIITEKLSWRQILLYSSYGVLITIAIILTRIIWIYAHRGLTHFFIRRDAEQVRLSKTYFRHALISSWAGMRGIVSLTAALALPLTLLNGTPLAGRDIVIFLTFEIIFLTLIIPGLTLPILIRYLKIQPSTSKQEIFQIRKKLADVVANEIHRLYLTKHIDDNEKDLLMAYFYSQQKITEIFSTSEDHRLEKARHRILHKQREKLTQMWLNNEVDDFLLSDLERELDIADSHSLRGDIS